MIQTLNCIYINIKYNLGFESMKQKMCEFCNTVFYERKSNYCSIECSKESSKIKISKARIKFLSENKDKHPWRSNNKHKSKPCEKLKEFLTKENINFVEEWIPLENRFFSIDIAFPDIKLGIEVNGNQHYNKDGTLRDYYQERHDLIESSGWKLIELHYSLCFNEDELRKVINFKTQPDYSEFFKIKENKQKSKIICLPKGEKNRKKGDLKWEPYKSLVINSNIDFKNMVGLKK